MPKSFFFRVFCQSPLEGFSSANIKGYVSFSDDSEPEDDDGDTGVAGVGPVDVDPWWNPYDGGVRPYSWSILGTYTPKLSQRPKAIFCFVLLDDLSGSRGERRMLWMGWYKNPMSRISSLPKIVIEKIATFL